MAFCKHLHTVALRANAVVNLCYRFIYILMNGCFLTPGLLLEGDVKSYAAEYVDLDNSYVGNPLSEESKPH